MSKPHKRLLLIFDKYCSGNDQLDIGIGEYVFIQTAKKLPEVECYPFYLSQHDVSNPADFYRRLEEAIATFQPDLIVMAPHFVGGANGNTCLPDRYHFKRICRGIPSVFVSYDTGNDRIIFLSTGKPNEQLTWINYWDGYADIIAHTDCYYFVQSEFPPEKYLSKHVCAFTPFDPDLAQQFGDLPRDIDYAFMGSVYRYRAPFIQALQKLPYQGFVGDGPQTGHALDYSDYLKILKRSKIAINFSKSWRGDGEQIKVRIWEILTSGSLLFEQDSRESRRILERYDCAVFFEDPEDLAQKVNHLLQNPHLIPAKLKASQEFLTYYNYQRFWQLVFEAAESLQYRPTQRRQKPQPIQQYQQWISAVSGMGPQLPQPLPSPDALNAIAEIAAQTQPSQIIELGTGTGLATRSLLQASPQSKLTTLDLSFHALRQSQQLLPLDSSKVQFLEQDILVTDFKSLWQPTDKVLLYLDAPDKPGVPIMESVLRSAVPFLPADSIVVINQLWHCPSVLSKANVAKFWQTSVKDEIDPLEYFETAYAAYWKGGAVLGGRGVTALMQWVNNNRIELRFYPEARLVSFQVPQLMLSGQFSYSPISHFVVQRGEEQLPHTQQALSLCQQGAQLYAAGQVLEAKQCFEQATQANSKVGGAFYALGVCWLKLGDRAAAIHALQRELKQGTCHPNTQQLLSKLTVASSSSALE